MTVRGAEGTSRPTRNRASYQITGSIRMTSTEVTMEVDASGSLALQSRLYHFPPPAPSYPVLRLRGWVGRSRGRGRFVDVRERSPPAAHGNTRTSAGATIRAWNQPSGYPTKEAGMTKRREMLPELPGVPTMHPRWEAILPGDHP